MDDTGSVYVVKTMGKSLNGVFGRHSALDFFTFLMLESSVGTIQLLPLSLLTGKRKKGKVGSKILNHAHVF